MPFHAIKKPSESPVIHTVLLNAYVEQNIDLKLPLALPFSPLICYPVSLKNLICFNPHVINSSLVDQHALITLALSTFYVAINLLYAQSYIATELSSS